ncbi:MAG: 50S ribosomal protein L6 [Verrucomicrobiia bacterium]
MSRIGNKNIPLPEKVKCVISPHGEVSVEGPKGKLAWKLPAGVSAEVKDQAISLVRKAETRSNRALHGLSRALIANMVTGVTTGFTRNLEIHGVGFRAAVKGNQLDLSLGFSHPVLFPIPEGIKITVTDNTKIAIEGIDKQKVGQVAANIRAYYPPEPYKGKGVRYADERVLRKEGKKQA